MLNYYVNFSITLTVILLPQAKAIRRCFNRKYFYKVIYFSNGKEKGSANKRSYSGLGY